MNHKLVLDLSRWSAARLMLFYKSWDINFKYGKLQDLHNKCILDT